MEYEMLYKTNINNIVKTIIHQIVLLDPYINWKKYDNIPSFENDQFEKTLQRIRKYGI